jgi:hypothetical protein
MLARIGIIAAIAALTLGASAHADDYKLDAKGRCHAADGKFADKELCTMGANARCHDPKTGHFAKCRIGMIAYVHGGKRILCKLDAENPRQCISPP